MEPNLFKANNSINIPIIKTLALQNHINFLTFKNNSCEKNNFLKLRLKSLKNWIGLLFSDKNKIHMLMPLQRM